MMPDYISEGEALDDIMENGVEGCQYDDGEFAGLPYRPALRNTALPL